MLKTQARDRQSAGSCVLRIASRSRCVLGFAPVTLVACSGPDSGNPAYRNAYGGNAQVSPGASGGSITAGLGGQNVAGSSGVGQPGAAGIGTASGGGSGTGGAMVAGAGAPTAGAGGTGAGAGGVSGGAGVAMGGAAGSAVVSAGGMSGGAGVAMGGAAGASAAGASGQPSAGAGMAGMAGMAGTAGTVEATFSAVADVMQAWCGAPACHGGGPDGQDLIFVDRSTLHTTLMTRIVSGCENAVLVAPNDPENSALLKLVTWQCADIVMPQGCIYDPCLPSDELATITAWIEAGAPGP